MNTGFPPEWRPSGEPPNEALKFVRLGEFKSNGHKDPSSSSSPYIGDGDSDDALQVVNARQFPTQIKPRVCVVGGLVPERHVTTLYGAGGTTKSILALSLLLAAARGDSVWLGLAMRGKRYKCLYVDFELDLEAQAERALKLIKGSGYAQLPDNFNYLAAGGNRPEDVLEFVYRYTQETSVNLLAIDSVGLAMMGDAGQYLDVIKFFRDLDRFRTKLRSTVLLVDHQANLGAGEAYQAKGAFGSSYKGNLSRSRIQVELVEHAPGVRRIALRHNKANFTEYVDPFEVEVAFTDEAIKLTAVRMADESLVQEQQVPAWKRALLTLYKEDDSMDRTELSGSLGVSYGTMGNVLTRLRTSGYVRDSEKAAGVGTRRPVEITNSGQEFVEKFLDDYRYPPKAYEQEGPDEDPPDTSSSSPPYYRNDDDDGALSATPHTYITEPGELAEVHEWIDSSSGRIGLDLETTGLDPGSAEISLAQLSDGGTTYILDVFALGDAVEETMTLLAGKWLVSHNAEFEQDFIRTKYGIELMNIADTLLMNKVLEQGDHLKTPKGWFTLEGVVGRYLHETISKEEQESDWSARPLTHSQLAYAAQDAAILVDLHEVLSSRIMEEGLAEVLDIETRAKPAFRWLEETGVYVDRAKLEDYLRDLEERAEDLHSQLKEFADINWNSSHQLIKFFGLAGKKRWPKTSKGQCKTGDAELRSLKHPAVVSLLEWRKMRKTISTYGKSWVALISEDDGRLRARYDLMGTVTGRTSCRSPNLQNLPRKTVHKSAIVAPEGRVLVKADYSQIELRIAAKFAPDENLLRFYQQGAEDADAHTLMAAAITGKTHSEISKDERTAAKAANFGPLYGMGAKSLRAYARNTYGVKWSPSEAKEVLETFRHQYPGIAAWHRTGYSPSETNREELAATRTFAGRRRRLFKSVMEWFNAPIQGTGADGAKLAMALLYEHRREVESLRPILFVHDEIVVECDEADAERAKELLIRCMRDGMDAVLNKAEPHVPVEVDAEIGRSWS